MPAGIIPEPPGLWPAIVVHAPWYLTRTQYRSPVSGGTDTNFPDLDVAVVLGAGPVVAAGRHIGVVRHLSGDVHLQIAIVLVVRAVGRIELTSPVEVHDVGAEGVR